MAERPLSAGPFHWLGLLAIAVAGLAADQLTKQIVVTQLQLGESVHVIGPLSIRHVNDPVPRPRKVKPSGPTPRALPNSAGCSGWQWTKVLRIR